MAHLKKIEAGHDQCLALRMTVATLMEHFQLKDPLSSFAILEPKDSKGPDARILEVYGSLRWGPNFSCICYTYRSGGPPHPHRVVLGLQLGSADDPWVVRRGLCTEVEPTNYHEEGLKVVFEEDGK